MRRELFALGVSKCFVLAVTCVPGARAASSRFAAELALSLAEPGQARVLAVEGDLDAPLLHQRLRVEMPQGEGLSEQLARAARDAEHVWTVARCKKSLHVLAEGPGMSSNRPPMGALPACIETVRACYDFIVVDGMPTGDAAIATALDTLADGVVVVSPKGATDEAKRLLAAFEDKRFSRLVESP